MVRHPRNVRSKTPRPPRRVMQLELHFAAGETPTPPPVAVSVAPRPAPAPAARRRRAWPLPLGALAALLALLFAQERVTRPALSWLPEARELALAVLRVEAPPGAAMRASMTEKPAARALVIEPAPALEPPPPAIRHDGYEPIPGGVLIAPKSFRPKADGAYDLVVHFHGDVGIVRESVEHAGIDAALAIVNVGITSGPYRDEYQATGTFEALLAKIDRALQKRGLANPRLRRLALTAWSGGYGSVETILQVRKPVPGRDPLDAILILDGIHCGFLDGDPKQLLGPTIEPFVGAARAAAEGRMLLSITHSEIDPVLYASTARTAAYLLERVGAKAVPSSLLPLPPELHLEAARNAVPRDEVRRLIPTADTRIGLFRVQGFKGNGRGDHAAHLTQMAVIGLADLARRWSREL